MSTIKAISIRQPWSTLIVQGHKEIENRTWNTKHRGYILIHAGKTFDRKGYDWLMSDDYFNKIELLHTTSVKFSPRGGIVGIAKLVDVMKPGEGDQYNRYRDIDQFGWVLKEAKPLPFHSLKGRLSLFDVLDVENIYPEIWKYVTHKVIRG